MTHPTDDTIRRYAGHQLGGRELAALEAHLALCDRCRQEVDLFRAIDGVILGSPEPAWEPEMLLAEVARRTREGAPVRPWFRRKAWRLATMAAALALVLGVALYAENAHYWHGLEQENRALYAEHYSFVAEPNVQPVSMVVAE